jgi:beta-xylosidase
MGTVRSPTRCSVTSSPTLARSRELELRCVCQRRLDLGPAYRLEDGKQIYGQGIWAPSFRYHNGTFYIFSNVNGQTTQVFRATNPQALDT